MNKKANLLKTLLLFMGELFLLSLIVASVEEGAKSVDPLRIGVEDNIHTINTPKQSKNSLAEFSSGLKFSTQEYGFRLVPFVVKNGQRQTLAVSAANLPFKRLDFNNWKFNITIPALPSQISHVGFYIANTTGILDVEPEKEFIRITADNATSAFLLNISDIPLPYAYNETEILIDVAGLSSLHLDPTVTITANNDVEAIDITPWTNNSILIAWCDETLDDILARGFYLNGTAKTDEITVDAAIGNCEPGQVGISALNNSAFVVGYTDIAATDAFLTFWKWESNTVSLTLNFPVDSTTGLGWATDTAALNFTDAVMVYEDIAANDTTINAIPSSGVGDSGLIDIDTAVGISNAVAIVNLNDTHYLAAYRDQPTNTIRIQYIKRYATAVTNVGNGASAGENSVALAAINASYFSIGVDDYTGTDSYEAAFYSISANGLTNINTTTLDTSVTPGTSSISGANVNGNLTAIAWYADSVKTVEMAVLDPYGVILDTWVVQSSVNAFTQVAVASNATGMPGVDLCGNIVVAYAGNSSHAYFEVFYPNGTASPGNCYYTEAAAPPAVDNNGTLNVTFSNGNINITQNSTFTINASVICQNGNCHQVNATPFFNWTGAISTRLNDTALAIPFFNVTGFQNQTCGFLSQDGNCSINWTVNATGKGNYLWSINFTSNNSYVLPNGSNVFRLNISNIVTAADSCTCPGSGNWEIVNGDVCTLTTTCNLGANKLRIVNGKLRIMSGGKLVVHGGCFKASGSSLYADPNSAGLFCFG